MVNKKYIIEEGESGLYNLYRKVGDNYGNVNCRYAYYGLNRLRCSRAGNEGNYCNYWKNCIHFERAELEID